MATQPVINYSHDELLPFQQPQLAFEVSGQFAPNLDLPKGQTIAYDSTQKKLVAYNESAPDIDTNEVQTLTFSATPASGNFTLGINTGSGVQTTGNIPFGANGAAITSALEALSNVGPGDIVATRSANVITFTYGAVLAGKDVPPIVFTPVALLDGSSAAITGTVATPTPGVDSTGSGTAVGFTRYPIKTDADGNITNFDEYGILEDTGPYYYCGIFRTTHLIGLTANALADLKGRIIQGTLADGVVRF